MLFKFLTKSIRRVKSHFAMEIASVLFGAAAITASTVPRGIGEHSGQEFRNLQSIGADLMVQSRSNTTQQDQMTDKEKKERLAWAIREYEKMLAYDED